MLLANLVRKAQSALLTSPLPSSLLTLSLQLLTSVTGCAPSVGSCNGDQSTAATGTWPLPATTDGFATSASTSADACLLRRVLDMLDADGDGYVSAAEMTRHLGTLGLSDDEEAVREALAGGRLDYEGLKSLSEGGGRLKEEEEEVVEAAFAVFDEDGDGLIGVEELQRVLLGLGFTQCRDPFFCHGIIASLDPRLDGFIDFPHFRRMLLD